MNQLIRNHKALKDQINSLELEIRREEQILSEELKKIMTIVSDPAPVIKSMVSDLVRDKSFRKDLFKIGLSIGMNYTGRLLQSPGAGGAIVSTILDITGGKEKAGNALKKLFGVLSDKIKSNKS